MQPLRIATSYIITANEVTSTGMGEKGKNARGHLIVVEGLDRSGKTTQCHMLCEDIGGLDKEFKYIKFPGEPSLPSVRTSSDSLARPNDRDRPDDQCLPPRQCRAE